MAAHAATFSSIILSNHIKSLVQHKRAHLKGQVLITFTTEHSLRYATSEICTLINLTHLAAHAACSWTSSYLRFQA